MKQTDNTEFGVTIGISRGNNYIFVTHSATGKQWMSKSPVESKTNIDMVKTNVTSGITKFDPTNPIHSCDHRFWMPVKQ